MSKLRRFGIQVVRVFGITANDQRHALNDVNARLGQDFNFARVIGQQTHFIHAQQLEHIRTQGEITLIGSKA
ncbi:hypothetical protein D3C86_2175620 [compost metagenome]